MWIVLLNILYCSNSTSSEGVVELNLLQIFNEIKNKYIQKWDNMVNIKRINEIKKQEAFAEKNEKNEEEALLNQL